MGFIFKVDPCLRYSSPTLQRLPRKKYKKQKTTLKPASKKQASSELTEENKAFLKALGLSVLQ